MLLKTKLQNNIVFVFTIYCCFSRSPFCALWENGIINSTLNNVRLQYTYCTAWVLSSFSHFFKVNYRLVPCFGTVSCRCGTRHMWRLNWRAQWTKVKGLKSNPWLWLPSLHLTRSTQTPSQISAHILALGDKKAFCSKSCCWEYNISGQRS